MICPYCLQLIEKVVSHKVGGEGDFVFKCPHANCLSKRLGDIPIPVQYPKECNKFRPLPICLFGKSGHGKTRFMEGFISELSRLGKVWRGFNYGWIDDRMQEQMRMDLTEFGRGNAEWRPTQTDLPIPRILRLKSIPGLPWQQLFLFDHGGETFEDTDQIVRYGAHFGRTQVIIWLMSLIEAPMVGDPLEEVNFEEFDVMITRYQSAALKMKANPKKQRMIVALTKAERLREHYKGTDALDGSTPFPKSACDLLDQRFPDGARDPWQQLERTSADLRNWLLDTGSYHNIVTRLEDVFERVDYCAISAQGRESPTEGESVRFSPRAVLAPLLLACRRHPGVWIVPPGGEKKFYSSHLEIAVAQAVPHSRIELEPGSFVLNQELVINKPLTICGVDDRSAIHGKGPSCLIRIETSGEVRLESLALVRKSDAGVGDIVRIERGRGVFDKVEFEGALSSQEANQYGAALSVREESVAVVTRCEFRKNTLGISMLSVSLDVLSLESCIFEDNKFGVASAGGELFMKSNIFRNNSFGLVLKNRAICRSEDDHFQACEELSVFVAGEAQLTMNRGRLDGDHRSAIALSAKEKARVTLTDCVASQHDKVACELNGESDFVCERTSFFANEEGILFDESSVGRISACRFENTNRYAIRIIGEASPVIAENQYRGNRGECEILINQSVQGNELSITETDDVRIKDLQRKKSKSWF